MKNEVDYVVTNISIPVTSEVKRSMLDVLSRLEVVKDELNDMSTEERIIWLSDSVFPHPVSFVVDEGGTIYQVNSIFNLNAVETIRDKLERVTVKDALQPNEDMVK